MLRVKSFAKNLILKQPYYLILQKPDLKQWDKFLFPLSHSSNLAWSLDNQILDVYNLFNEFFSRPLEYPLEYSFVVDALPANMLRWIDEQRICRRKLSSDDNGFHIFSHIYKDFNDEEMINSEHAPCLEAVEAVTNDIKVQEFGSIFEIKHKKVNFKPLNCDTKAPNDEQTSTVSLMKKN